MLYKVAYAYRRDCIGTPLPPTRKYFDNLHRSDRPAFVCGAIVSLKYVKYTQYIFFFFFFVGETRPKPKLFHGTEKNARLSKITVGFRFTSKI